MGGSARGGREVMRQLIDVGRRLDATELGVTYPLANRAERSDVEVELELLAAVPVPRSMPLSWEFTVRWLASFGGVDQHQPEQIRNSASGLVRLTKRRPGARCLLLERSPWQCASIGHMALIKVCVLQA